VQVLLVTLGLGAVVAASATAYTVLRLAGAAWVVWLGVSAIRHRSDAEVALAAAGHRSDPGAAVRTGLLVGLNNPKTIVFFVAFLPQFTDEAAGHVGLQVAALGLLFAVLAVLSDSAWAMAAGTARDWFARRPERLDAMGVAGGVMMIGLGATLLAAE
jgi:threonine/homoserine/homoserine lactone efflux protein